VAKFRVHYEASAAIGIEIEVEADDEDHATFKAEELYIDGKLRLSDLVEELMKPTPEAIEGYGNPLIKYVTVEEDESGFEVVDVFKPELVEP
jgi:hypothetical protein